MTTGVPIAHYEDKYEVFPDGRIWNKGNHTWKAYSENPNGYFKVLLSLNGKRKQLLVHQVVAKHFLPNPYGHIQVNHKDGNKSNNAVSNLEWVSKEENIQHSLETGLRKGYMSMDEKLTHLDSILQGKPVNELAEEIGRHPVTLSKMCRQAAQKVGRIDEWTEEMKRRRRNVAIRNLESRNS